MSELVTKEDGDIITVGHNYDDLEEPNVLRDALVYVEIYDRLTTKSIAVGLTRDETADLIDMMTKVLEDYDVAPTA